MSVVKNYLCKEWYKIEAGLNKVSLQDFVFHRAVKLGMLCVVSVLMSVLVGPVIIRFVFTVYN